MIDMSKFKSPGIYTQERDTSGYRISKRQIRMGKINYIFNIKNILPIISIPYGSDYGFVIFNNYDEMKNKYK